MVSGLGLEGVAWVESRIRDCFEVHALAPPKWERVEEEVRAARGANGNAYAAYRADGTFRILVAREETRPVGGSLVDRLDVAVLHELLLGPMVECDPSGSNGPASDGPTISYLVNPAEAAQRVERGESQFAFFLRGTKVEQIIEVARAGERMPKKSTYFFPKAAAGLVISSAVRRATVRRGNGRRPSAPLGVNSGAENAEVTQRGRIATAEMRRVIEMQERGS